MESGLYEGTVHHRRRHPVEHDFSFGLFMVYLDLAELPQLTAPGGPLESRGSWLFSTRSSAVARFRREDHLGPEASPLDEHVRSRIEASLGRRPVGPIRLLTNLRYWGLAFNPVSLYYCFDAAGALDAVLADVTNTPWGERHVYVVDVAAGQIALPKAFHVSPFMGMDQSYQWHFESPDDWLRMGIETRQDGADDLFSARLVMRRQPLTSATLRRAMLRHPWMTAQVLLGIYSQALRLWTKGARFHSHPRYRAPSEANA